MNLFLTDESQSLDHKIIPVCSKSQSVVMFLDENSVNADIKILIDHVMAATR